MRRTNQVVGMINFPVDSLDYENTYEGGMFVELWCVETEYNSCGICCGYGNISSIMSETLVGTDEEINTDNFHEIEGKETIKDWNQRFFLEEKLFPNISEESRNVKVKHNLLESFDEKNKCNNCRYNSLPLIACLTMGSTGWSGSNKDGYWRCKYNDLNESGKNIYDILKSVYPKSKLILVTWLDT